MDIHASRRGFLGAGLGGALGTTALAGSARATPPPLIDHHAMDGVEPFYGRHQGGIATPAQKHLYFAALDLVTVKREDVIGLLKRWTQAAARLTAGLPVDGAESAEQAPVDSGEADGLGPARLTLTFGFGAGLFKRDGVDRYSLTARRPEALIDLPRFNGDQLIAERTGGDLCIQACADNAQVVLHAVRHLARIGQGAVQFRWAQAGFAAGARPGETPRNLMGFKDGTMNPDPRNPSTMNRFVWVGDEGGWMKGGSYLVARPIRVALEHWDRMKLAFQEQVVGRHKDSGAPLGQKDEFEPLNLDATDANGDPLIPENSHTRLAAPQLNQGAQILRRAYSYDNGLAFIAERWPPWRQGMMLDAGLMFLCWQRDPRAGFVKIFENMAKFDMMNQFTTHIGSGLFACPPGGRPGGFIGETLFHT
jgi:deferrochelatase/peroxidase EfeB